jgi:PAS domain S-box-containing protein
MMVAVIEDIHEARRAHLAVEESRTALETANQQLTAALSERDSMMQTLAATEAEFRASFEAAAVGKVQWEAQTLKIVRVNPALARMLGYEPEEMMDRPTSDFIWPEDRDHSRDLYNAFLEKNDGGYVLEMRYLQRDGAPRWIRASIALAPLSRIGAGGLVVAVVEDIDESRKAQEALAQSRTALEVANAQLTEALAERSFALHTLTISEEEFRASFEDSAVGKLQVDLATTRIVRANRAFAHMLGYKPEELIEHYPRDFTHPDELETDQAEYARFLAGEIPAYIREKRFVCKDGSHRWARVSGTIGQSIAYGRPQLMVAEIEDIDEQYRARAALEGASRQLESSNRLLSAALDQRDRGLKTLAVSEAAFRASFEWAAVGKLQADPHTGLIIRANAAFAAMLGYEPQELVGKSWELTWPEDAQSAQAKYREMMAGGATGFVHEKRYLHKDGRPIWGRLASSVVRDPTNGEPTLLITDVENIDTEHKARQALEAAKRELEGVVVERTAALTQRDILLREVYHRVKNNLQIIDSFLVMQARRLTDPAAVEAMLSLRRRVFALGLVHHQLMGSANLRTFDVAPFLQALSLNILEGGADRGVTLSVKALAMDVGLDFAIPLGLLVNELVTNSLKHAFPDGAGNISVILERADNGDVALTVADDGRGQGEHAQNGAARTNLGKSGLGSSIIAGLVAQLRGTMTMNSEMGTRAEIRVASPVLS